jgi:AcrR family transcriptional regulator
LVNPSTDDAGPASARPRRAKGERTEEQFRAAARRVFARDGYLVAKVEDIAAEAGKSPGSFYNYFESKNALLASIAKDFHVRTRTAIAELRNPSRSPEESLRSAIGLWVRNYRDRVGEMSGVFQASMVDPVFNEMWRAIRADAVAFIARDIRRAQKDGYAPGLNPVVAASALSSMLEHHCYVWLAQGGDDPSQPFDEEAAVDTLSALWYHAVYWRSP